MIIICFFKIMILLYLLTRGLQRDVVYLSRPIASSYVSPNAGGEEWSCGLTLFSWAG
jgi:hypothetical protein